MAKITSKLQVTIPKSIAEQYAMRPGDQIEFVPAGEVIRVLPPGGRRSIPDVAMRLRVFDKATRRQREREGASPSRAPGEARGWTREELYERGRAD